jgi:hypothetical protein
MLAEATPEERPKVIDQIFAKSEPVEKNEGTTIAEGGAVVTNVNGTKLVGNLTLDQGNLRANMPEAPKAEPTAPASAANLDAFFAGSTKPAAQAPATPADQPTSTTKAAAPATAAPTAPNPGAADSFNDMFNKMFGAK